jgi:hypothetical protein
MVNAQEIEGHTLSRMAFFAAGKKDTSGRPVFGALRRKRAPKKFYAFILGFT